MSKPRYEDVAGRLWMIESSGWQSKGHLMWVIRPSTHALDEVWIRVPGDPCPRGGSGLWRAGIEDILRDCREILPEELEGNQK